MTFRDMRFRDLRFKLGILIFGYYKSTIDVFFPPPSDPMTSNGFK